MRLKLCDGIRVLHRDADIVQPFHQTPPNVVIDLKIRRQITGADRPFVKIDRDLEGRIRLNERPQFLNNTLVHLGGQESTLA